MATRVPQPPRPTKAELTLLERGLPTDRQMQDRLADAMLVWLSPLLDALRKRVIGMVGAEVVRGNIPMPALAKGLKDNLFDDEEWWRGVADEWEDPVRQWVRQAFGQTAQYQASRWYFYTDMRRINRVALDYTQNDYIPDLIRLDGSQSFINATRQRVVELIDLWERGELPGGRGLRDLEDALGDIFSPVRARRIAVTEATRVYAEASRAAWLRSYRDSEYNQAYGIVGQRWSTARDEFVCPVCAPLNGKVVLLDEEFPVEAGYEGEPPAHPNCRCVLIPTRTYNPAFRPAGAAKPSKADIDRVRAYTSIPEDY